MSGCVRCHHVRPNPNGCAACNPEHLGERLTEALVKVATLEAHAALANELSEARDALADECVKWLHGGNANPMIAAIRRYESAKVAR